MPGLVEGSLALVTGASSGIGRATCQVLAREGATVVVTCIDEAGAKGTLASLPGSNHMMVKYDVTQFSKAKELVKTIVDKYKRPPNILVNSAGIQMFISLLDETPETFDKTLNINLKGSIFTAQAVCQALVDAKLPGAIINVASHTGHRGFEGMLAYASSKCALEGVTRCMAKEMAPHNIRVNGVFPGMVETPMSSKCTPELIQGWLDQCATKRKGQPIEVGEVIAFLASDKASYVNGTHVSVAAGYL